MSGAAAAGAAAAAAPNDARQEEEERKKREREQVSEEVRKRWEGAVSLPGALSSARYLAKGIGEEPGPHPALLRDRPGFKQVEKATDSFLKYLIHRDLTSRFLRRGVYTGSFGEHLEGDLGDLGKKVTVLLEEQKAQMKRDRQDLETSPSKRGSTSLPARSTAFAPDYLRRDEPSRLFLIVVDAFSHLIFARGLSRKTGDAVAEALKSIIEEAREYGEPQVLYTDNGREFIARPFVKACRQANIRHRLAEGQHKARLAERGIRTLKRIIMTSIQSGNWPPDMSWDELIRGAAKNANSRYNRSIKMSANEGVGHYWDMLEREWGRRNMETLKEYTEREHAIREGKPFIEGKKQFRLNQDVLMARPKKVRGKVKDKEFMWHYYPEPFKVVGIYHAEKPALYKLKDPRTGQLVSRLHYAKELQPITLPEGMDSADITDYRVVPGGKFEYRLRGRGWVGV